MTKCCCHVGRRFCDWNNCLMLIYQFKDYHLSVLQKFQHSDTCNHVKSCTKHGRPNQSQRKLTVALMDKMSVYFKQILSCFAKKVYRGWMVFAFNKSRGLIWRKRHKRLSCFEKFEEGCYRSYIDSILINFNQNNLHQLHFARLDFKSPGLFI